MEPHRKMADEALDALAELRNASARVSRAIGRLDTDADDVTEILEARHALLSAWWDAVAKTALTAHMWPKRPV